MVWLLCSDYTIRIAPSAARCGRRQQKLAAAPLSHLFSNRELIFYEHKYRHRGTDRFGIVRFKNE